MCSLCRYYDDDQEVVSDNELQELVNELSADGKQGDFGGKGHGKTMELKQITRCLSFYKYCVNSSQPKRFLQNNLL